MITNSIVESESRLDGFERYVVGLAALICAGGLVLLSLLGPLGLGLISYKTSISALYQVEGQDLVNLLLIAPLCLIGGILHFRKDENSKYFLILVPIYTVLYVGYAYGVGMEWSNSQYTGNSEQYFWLYLLLMITGFILLLSSLSMFSEENVPDFNPKSLKIYIGFITVFLVLFALMWFREIIEVLTIGNTSSGSYLDSPTVFWAVKYLDTGFTIPLGFISLYLLATRPKKAYPFMLLFFGFFITLSTAVFAMAIVMLLNGDPSLQAEGLVIFPILMILAYAGFFYLIKDKIPWLNR
ncbi:MAG: hypothetical protein ACXAEU_13865 [Candidatus Hodarchaeales archaeon]|jgi:hypothetical protein